jgi:predicted alpha-1,6-mannanase (GH76 family)
MVTDNDTLIELAEKNFRWLASSGTISLQNGTVNDGVDSSSCNVSTSQWSYTYGMLVGGLAWLSQATGNTTYLSLAGPFLNTIVRQFAPTGVVRENCELDGSCNNDQMNFKVLLLHASDAARQ